MCEREAGLEGPLSSTCRVPASVPQMWLLLAGGKSQGKGDSGLFGAWMPSDGQGFAKEGVAEKGAEVGVGWIEVWGGCQGAGVLGTCSGCSSIVK